ncbi:type IV pilus assembly protein PilM [Glaciecola siphonariae]|uniref:Type IV pilus assembly protein PilM n=1 Tax=Glaciecola siphonariae TaxID=521012 RepID=A0ABV9LWT6_9ALTE
MKSLFQKKAKTIIGLDIGTKFVKAISLDVSSSQCKVLAFACEPIVGAAFAEREIKDFDAISKALKKVQMSVRSKSKECAIAVAGSSVISKMVYMEPDQSDFELETQIELEADSLIPYPLDEVYLDFQEIAPSKSHIGKVEVLLSAAHRDLIDSRITLVREAPFEPVIVDIESNVLGDSFMRFGNSGDSDIGVCINLGASLMQICVTEGKRVIYNKEHSFGVNSFIQDLAMLYNIDGQEVESQLASGTAPDTWFSDNLPAFISSLQQQIQRALQMFVATTHKPMPSSFTLSGGGANLPNICEDLSRDMAMKVRRFNAFEKMEFDSRVNKEKLLSVAPQLTIATGLATRSLHAWRK